MNEDTGLGLLASMGARAAYHCNRNVPIAICLFIMMVFFTTVVVHFGLLG